jgi:hypothetical protein
MRGHNSGVVRPGGPEPRPGVTPFDAAGANLEQVGQGSAIRRG